MQNIVYFLPGACVREPRPRDRIATPGTSRVRVHLADLIARLQLAQAAASTCVAALRRQNCEIDEDVARLLQRCVADALGAQIEETEELLGALEDASR